MHPFKDCKDREWRLEVNVTTLGQVKSELGISLFDGTEYGPVIEDVQKFVSVLYVLCRDQADAKDITPAEFGRGFAGDALEAAESAFGEEMVSFFRNPDKRELMRKALAKGRDLGNLLTSRAQQRMDKIEPEKVADLLEKKLSESSGSAPASLESILEGILSDNS